MGFSIFPVTGFPLWITILLVAIDWSIRLIALGWIPNGRRPSVALGWLVAVFFIPYVGIIAFLMFGSAKLPRHRREKQREVNRLIRASTAGGSVLGDIQGQPDYVTTAARLNYELGALPLIGGNYFELVEDNNACLLAMAQSVDQAESYVHFEFYIVAGDESSWPLLNALIAAHERGVRVNVLIDHVGSLGYPGYSDLVKKLDRSGVAWRRMLPIRPWRGEFQRIDLRNHRKLLVVDGNVAFTGSQNIIDKSYNKKKNLKRGLEWKDLMVKVTGPLVAEINAIFVTDWFSETNRILTSEMQSALPESPAGGALAQVIPSGPGFDLENNLRVFNHLIYNAEDTIVVCSPYFVPDESLMMSMTTAALSGVTVRLYVGETSDSFLALKAQQSYYDELASAGVEIYLYHAPTVLHSKFMLIDDDVAVIGSSNMDERSFAMNLEISLMVPDRDFVARLYALEAKDYGVNSVRLDAARWEQRSIMSRYVENVCRLASALL